MMEDKERNAFESWLQNHVTMYIDNLREDDTLTEVEKRASVAAVSSFAGTMKQDIEQMALYVVACNEDYDGAVYGIYEDIVEQENEDLDFLKRMKEAGIPILQVHSVLLDQRY